MTAPPEHGTWLDVDGTRLWVTRRGRGDPLIMIHGWTLDLRMWSRQVPVLAAHHCVTCYDRRGFGRSPGLPDPVADLADLEAIIKAASSHRVVLCGASQGARLALRYAAARPRDVAALILQGAPLDGFPPPPDSAEAIPAARWAALAQAGHMNRVRREWLAHPLMTTRNAELEGELREMVDTYSGADLARPLAESVQAPNLSGLDIPTLIIVGDGETAWRRAVAQRLATEIPGARLEVIDSAGHLANLDNPDAFNSLVSDFLARLPEPAG